MTAVYIPRLGDDHPSGQARTTIDHSLIKGKKMILSGVWVWTSIWRWGAGSIDMKIRENEETKKTGEREKANMPKRRPHKPRDCFLPGTPFLALAPFFGFGGDVARHGLLPSTTPYYQAARGVLRRLAPC